jgi:hypothetical protein
LGHLLPGFKVLDDMHDKAVETHFGRTLCRVLLSLQPLDWRTFHPLSTASTTSAASGTTATLEAATTSATAAEGGASSASA